MAKKAGAGLGVLDPYTTVIEQNVTGAFESLPEKKQIFIKELHKNGWNKTQAGLKAGCKSPAAAHMTATNWLKQEKVKQAIEEFQIKDNKAASLKVDDLKAELWKNHLRANRVSDSNKSLELILRIMGAFKDNVEIKQEMTLSQVLEDLRGTSTRRNDQTDDSDISVEKVINAFSVVDLPDNGESSPDNEAVNVNTTVDDNGGIN